MTEAEITRAAALIEMRQRGRAMAASAKTCSARHETMQLSLQPVSLGAAKGSIETAVVPVESAIALGEWMHDHATLELEKLGVDL